MREQEREDSDSKSKETKGSKSKSKSISKTNLLESSASKNIFKSNNNFTESNYHSNDS